MISQGRHEMISEEPRPCCGDGAVNRGDKAPLALAGQCRNQLEVPPRRRIDLHDRARYHPPWRLEMWRAIQLGQPDIVDEGSGRSHFRAAEIAKPVEGADTIEILKAVARALALEACTGERCQSRLPLGKELE